MVEGYGTAGRQRGCSRRSPALDPTKPALPPRPVRREYNTASGRAQPKKTRTPGRPATGGGGGVVQDRQRVGNTAPRRRRLRDQGSKAGVEGPPRGARRPLGRCATETGGTTHVLGTGPGTLCVNLARMPFSAGASPRRAADRARGSHTSLIGVYVALPISGCGAPTRPTVVTAAAITDQVEWGSGSCRGALLPSRSDQMKCGWHRRRATTRHTTGNDSLCRVLSPVPPSVSGGVPDSHNVGTTRSLFVPHTARLIGRAEGSGKSETSARLGWRQRHRRTALGWATAGFHGWSRGADLGEQWR